MHEETRRHALRGAAARMIEATAPVPARADRLLPAERRLRAGLRGLGALLLAAALLYALGALVGPARGFFAAQPFVAGSAGKAALLGMTALYAAGEVRRRFELALVVLGAHVLSIASALLALAAGETGGPADLGLVETTVATVLWGVVVLDGAIVVALSALVAEARRAVRDAGETAEPDPLAPEGRLTPAERRTARLCAVVAAAAAATGLCCVAGFLLPGTRDAFAQLPFVTNAVVLAGGVAALGWLVARDVRANLALTAPLATGLLVPVAAAVVFLPFTDQTRPFPLFGWDGEAWQPLVVLIALGAALGLALPLSARAAWRARERIAFLSPLQQRALLALADTLIAGEQERVPPRDVAANVEAYVGSIRARRVWVYRVVLTALELRPLLAAWPPLSEIEPVARRDFLEKRFLRPPPWPRFAKNLTQVMIRVGQQLSFAGYYNDRRAWRSIGYVPFSERGRPVPRAAPLRLAVELPGGVEGDELHADVCVVGSGAGGAIVAYELARAGRDVLLVERGPYVQPHEFSEDEVAMIGQLYGDGIMQQTRDFRFTILQGGCVGGSTTVNNAVCFRAPDTALRRWNDPAVHDAQIDLRQLTRSYRAVERFLDVHPQGEAVLNRSGDAFLAGAEAAGGLDVGVVRANVQDCVGCGYCNIGCAYGRKLSMLDRTLPRAQADFPGRVRIVAECDVERIETRGGGRGTPARATGLRAQLGGRTVTIACEDVVLSAGAIASSHLLQRSGIGGRLGPGPRLPVGRGLGFNMGAPLTAELPEPVNAYDGLQISHYGVPRGDDGYVFETWFNPPVAQALNMPGWFERHFDNMRRFDRLMAVGVIAGTAGNARVRRALTGGPDVDYRPRPEDLRTLGRGLRKLGELLFAAGATRVMLNTWGYDELRSPAELERIPELVADPDYVTLGTGHPQGGNAISADPRRGVVDPRLRVHGFANLHVCDASVFPATITVNPQLTVMALAHYAAPLIAAGD
jgi:choline dehydrogenase-like flavoprotein